MTSIPSLSSSPRRHRWLHFLFISVLVAGGLSMGGAIALAWYAVIGLPSIVVLQDHQPSLMTKVHADNGQVMGQFYVERRVFTPLDEVPQHLINAVIAVEDARFFKHPGLDIRGIFRAAWTNLKRGGKFEGASTITQQLARTLFLSPERTFQRKIRELILALKMEVVLTKAQILEMYLNQIYFGHGAYGIGNAATTYFGKDLSKLSVPESAFLAGLPKAPSTYSPYKNYGLGKRRQEHVLRRMAGENFITFDLAQEAIDTKLNFQPKLIERVAPYFLENIRQHLVNEYGESMVYKGGLQVFTTLNRQMQNWAEDALQKGLKDLDKRQGWRGPLRHEDQPTVLPKSPATEIPKYGQILEGVVTQVSKDKATVLVNNLMGTISLKDMLWAKRQLVKGVPVTEAKSFPINSVEQLLQSGDIIEVSLKSIKNKQVRFRLDQTPIVEGAIIAIDPRTGAIRAMVGGYDFERSEFNRALDSLRQPGSAFKPVIYATAIDGGMSPATLVLDAPVVYGQEDPRKTWKPENYEKRFFGPITLREALRHSRNAATVRLLEQVGVREVTNFSRKLGIQSPLNQDLSLALGSSEVTLVDITSAYGIFANQGLSLPPYTISIVRDQEEKILEQHLFKPRQVITKETAYLITHMMIDVIQNGTGKLARKIGRPLAGKTGTTNSYRDAWFVGYAPNLAVGVWVGFDSVETLGKVESGAHAALPIWTQFVSQTFQSLPVQTFAIPEGVRFVEIDQATGTLAKKPNRSTTTEVFAEGAIPHPPVIHTAHPLDFYEFDQLDETEIKNEE